MPDVSVADGANQTVVLISKVMKLTVLDRRLLTSESSSGLKFRRSVWTRRV